MNRKLIFGIFILIFLLVGTVTASYVNINKDYAGQGNGVDIYIDTDVPANTIDNFEFIFRYEDYSGVYDMPFGSVDVESNRFILFHSSSSAFNLQLGKSTLVNLDSLSTDDEIYKLQIIKNNVSNYRVIYTNLRTNTILLDDDYETLDSSPVSSNNLWIFARGELATPYYTSRIIYSFTINDETWNFNEGQGTTVTGDKGTELTVSGTLTNFWVDGDTTASNKNLQISSLNKGLVGHWTLDQDNYNSNTNRIGDSSPHENHFTNSGATSTTDRFGNANSAMAFDGSTNYAIINDNFVVSPTELTISAWLKKESGGATYECVLHKSSDATIGNTEFWLGVDNSDLLTATIGARTGVSGTWAAGRTTTTATYGQWYLLTATWNGTIVKVYLDGEYNKQYALTTYSNINYPTRLGASSNGANYEFKGDIDDVRIYNRALSADEVKLLYDSHKPQISGTSLNKGLILDMPLTSRYTKTETAGSEILTDRTPYSNDGTNTGATLSSEGAYFNDADNDYILSQQTHLFDSSHTYSVWIYPETTASIRGVLGNHFHTDFSNICFSVYNGRIYVSVGYTDNTRDGAYAVSTVYADRWTHVLVVFNITENTIKTYLNGKIDHTRELTKTVKFSSRNFLVGQWARSYTNNYKFKGNISNVKIYNRALSESEIQQLYNQGR
ncbi:MAG: LamG domain-containing protein [Candidatus Nanoarchaeia archaeon]|nr:LamG domain-containing protein [Candidatus Nanoarchaeia archaeon]